LFYLSRELLFFVATGAGAITASDSIIVAVVEMQIRVEVSA
jgi:hypothetical protein